MNNNLNGKLSNILIFMTVVFILTCSGCSKRPESEEDEQGDNGPSVEVVEDIPRFASNSPFDDNYVSPMPKKEKRLWARSALWEKAPEFVVEKWISEEAETEGKYVLYEFWATWCSQCRRSIPLLNGFHAKFKDELAVIAISDEAEETVRKYQGGKMEYFIAVDTEARMKDELAVKGLPHVIIVEPAGGVVWEGFPLQKGYELTDEIVEKILSVGRKAKTKP